MDKRSSRVGPQKMTAVSAAVCTLLLTGVSALAQSTDSAALQRVEITGSSIRRVAAETALPVTVLTHEDIDRTGATTAQDLVNMIPSNFGGTVVANNVGATGVASTAGLRGLPSKYTLVLLNGRRIANYAFGNSPVDLNSIPLSAVDRVEILRDGASAVYGADAVAGVINFILRKDYKGAEITMSGNKTKLGGGETQSINFTGGFGDYAKDGYNFLLSVNHENDGELKATQRAFGATANRPDLGINKSSPRNGVPNLNFTDTLGNSYTGVNPYRYNGCNNPEFALVIRDAKACGTDYVKYIDLLPNASHDNIVARGVFKLNAENEAYIEANHVEDTLVSKYSPAPYTVNMTYPTTGRFYPKSIVIPKGYTVPSGTTYKLADGSTLAAGTVLQNDISVTPTGPLSGTWRTVAGGGRTDITAQDTDRLLVGAKGSIAGWDYDTAFTYSQNHGVVTFGPGQFSYAKLTPLVKSGEINVFGSQDAASLAALNGALLTGPEQSGTSTSKEFDIRISKEIMQMANGPVALALGLSLRREDLGQVSYPVLESGDQVGGAGPIPSVSGGRKVYGLFSEVTVPLLKELELQGAARYDSYKNDFGTSFSNLSPKLGLRYQPTKALLFRASAGKGYRAPTLYENLRPFTSGNNTNANFSDSIRCAPGLVTSTPVGSLQDECNVQQPTALAGNKDLKPEKSTQYSFGMVFEPTSNLNVGIDYFNVKITDAIQQQSENQVFGDQAKFAGNFYRYNPALYPDGWSDDGSQTGAIKGSTNKDFPIAYVLLPYSNSGTFFASGIDLSAAFKQKVSGLGTFGVNLEGTYFLKHGYQYPLTASVSDLGVYKDFGPTPKWRHVLMGSYSADNWNVSLTQNYSAGYTDFVGTEAISASYPEVFKVKAFITYDTQVTWKTTKSLTLVGGVKNLTNQDPPTSRTEANFQTGYDAQFANPLGRTIYVRVNYKFN